MKKSIIIAFKVLLAYVSFAKASQHPNDVNNLQTLGDYLRFACFNLRTIDIERR